MSLIRYLVAAAFFALVAALAASLLIRVRRRREPWQTKAIPVTTTLAVICLLALYPIPLTPVESAHHALGSIIKERSGFPAVLLVGDVTAGSDFPSTDWTYAWLDLLEQEICGCSTVPLSSINSSLLQETKLLVVAASASSELNEHACSRLADWVKDGGALFVEQPSNALSTVTGVQIDASAEWTPNHVATLYDKSQLVSDLLRNMPLDTSCLRLYQRSDDCAVVMEMDDAPVAFRRPLGTGVVVTLLFDLGRQLTALQQGVPDQGFRVLDKRGAPGLIDPTDLILSTQSLECWIPYADVLERWVVSLVEDYVPVPRIWYFPGTYDGVVAMTHDEDWFGDASSFVSLQESLDNCSSTFFVIPRGPITPNGLMNISGYGGDIQIHWNREKGRWMAVFTKGDGSLAAQLTVLENKLEYNSDVSICRIERLRWGSDYTKPFRIMEDQGIQLDSSYGSAGRTGKGYMHSTGLPFHPIDTNGKPFSLWELPFQIQARYSGIDLSYIRGLVHNSTSIFHQVINALYHPIDLVEGSPSREDWLGFVGIARDENHRMMTLSAFLGWWEDRTSTNLSKMRWAGNVLSYTCECRSDELSAMVPSSIGDLTVQEVEIDGQRASHARGILLQGRPYLLVQLGRGSHQLDAVYR